MEVKTNVTFLKGDSYQVTFPAIKSGFIIDVSKTAEPSGPSPLDVFLASLAGCIGVYAKRYFAMHKIDFKKLDVAARADFVTESPIRLANIKVDVATDAVISDKETFMRFIHNCPVHNTLIHTKDVTITVE